MAGPVRKRVGASRSKGRRVEALGRRGSQGMSLKEGSERRGTQWAGRKAGA